MNTDGNITTILIDDDTEALALLELYLKNFPEILLIDRTTNPIEGVRLLKKNSPDLVFLDIDMPDLNGLAVAETIRENNLNTEVVFTTAHSHYAYQSLHLHPLDYLIKPFGPDDLHAVLSRYKEKSKNQELERKIDFLLRENKPISKIRLPVRTGVIFVDPEDIMLFQTESNNCRIYTKQGEEELILMNICKLVFLINSPAIFNLSRSTSINIKYLTRIDKKTRTCILQYNEVSLKARIRKSRLSWFERNSSFPIN
ncbi:MAG: LytR/AlgR family response regulator transcription factor [Mangrovibacterium sp.]